MWEPRHFTTVWAFTACYRDSFTFFTLPPYVFTAWYSIKNRDNFTFRPKKCEVLHLCIQSCVSFVRIAFPLHQIHETWQAKSLSFGKTNFVLVVPVRLINALFRLHQLQINELLCYLGENSEPWPSTVYLGMKDEGLFYLSRQLGLLFW
jgi:hypothetical protein